VANEVVLADLWLYSVLSGDATLAGLVGTKIYSYLAPGGTASPFVVYNFQGGTDVMAVGAIRIMNTGLYQIKGIVQSNSMSGVAKSIADRIDTLLHGMTGLVTGGIVLACVRQQPIAYVETSNGLRWNHLGGSYRLIVEAT
jgi:hypothetical protein